MTPDSVIAPSPKDSLDKAQFFKTFDQHYDFMQNHNETSDGWHEQLGLPGNRKYYKDLVWEGSTPEALTIVCRVGPPTHQDLKNLERACGQKPGHYVKHMHEIIERGTKRKHHEMEATSPTPDNERQSSHIVYVGQTQSSFEQRIRIHTETDKAVKACVRRVVLLH